MADSTVINGEVMKLVKASALARLKSYAQCPDFEIREYKNEVGVHAHWMSLILISGRYLRLTFKAHYSSDVAKNLAARAMGRSGSDITDHQAADFMKEFCNLTAGGIKKYFEDLGQSVGISLPLVTRGFDELFFSVPNLKTTFEDVFMLAYPESDIVGSVNVEIFDLDALKEFKYVEKQGSAQDDGEVDFL